MRPLRHTHQALALLLAMAAFAAACAAIDLGSNEVRPDAGSPQEGGPSPETGPPDTGPPDAGAADADAAPAYIKAPNTRAGARFGFVALDGNTLAVGAWGDSSGATGIGGDASDTSAPNAGAITVYTRSGRTWSQQAWIKASNARAGAYFGISVALSGDTLAVGSIYESSAATGIGGNSSDTSAPGAGAVYVFRRSGGTWSQQAYLKASNTRANAQFGTSVALSGDTLVVGSPGETSGATGTSGDPLDTSAPGAGAAYVFTRSGGVWSQQAYVKASNTRAGAAFGNTVAFSGDTASVGAVNEASAAIGVGGDQTDTSAPGAGAAYVFTRAGGTWSQQAYLKASNTKPNANLTAQFSGSLALSGDTLAVGSPIEASSAVGVGGDQSNTSAPNAGAMYIFTRSGNAWSQQAYLKASNTRTLALFGYSAALSGDDLVVGSIGESSKALGIGGDQGDTSAPSAGAAYAFRRAGGAWSQVAYLKATNSRAAAVFGYTVARSGATVAAGAIFESSGATGIGGDPLDTSAPSAGATYVFY